MKNLKMPSIIECNIDTLTERYGEFIAQPLEGGWGVTLGNALRRILLSSIEGAAITAVRFDGVLHEFTSIPGVTEDVTDIILNLKAIKFIMHSDEPKLLHLSIKGPAEVTAKDMLHDESVRILNPDAPIATLNEEGSLEMELQLEQGRGYVPADANVAPDPLFIAIDSLHSPVKKVNYEITETRVGEVTDFEKLKLKIWTNGAITPQEALTQSAELLVDHLKLFQTLTSSDAAVAPEGSQPKSIDKLESLLSLEIQELGFSNRVLKALKTYDILTVRDLVRVSESDLKTVKNFGQKSLKSVIETLEGLGLSLNMNV